MNFYDCHTHSAYSFDAKNSIEEMVVSAIEKGVKAITITEHPLPLPDGVENFEHIISSVEKTQEISKKYSDKILVLTGIEKDDKLPIDSLSPFEDLPFDCVVGSSHSQPLFRDYFADTGYIDFLDCARTESIEFLITAIKKYIERLEYITYNIDADTIAHITFPFRYLNGTAKRGIKISSFHKEYDKVLSGIIETGKSLEINTSGKATDWNEFMPDADILKRYFNMGGRNITLGSDAHNKDNIAVGFSDAILMLKEIGFKKGSYYIRRKRHEYNL